jgi:hypothetical protein
MKTYNTKLAVIVFSAIVALDACWYFLGHWISGGWLVYPITAINSPGIPLFRSLADFVRAGYLSDGVLIVGCVLFSAFVWSLISGFVFRQKHAA